ncbi:NTP transferase domain-containing protein [Janibacter sp. YIM B02568]|uniref:glucose-1-phosphate adenylyltransferase family protein n=1 Tax=Janibacter endophyticus TaxID=2806261 RepID=UPI00194EAE5D|nr:sugar phosphate nucleotidyltransferase [Janibacter endophyticus]MBM6545089.1 NTP transferase domain-containing protein [Janibacter endophyticus]
MPQPPFATPPHVLGIVQAGGKGSRMDVLTRERAKPAVPFGGSFQLIDFALSNLSNSGFPDVWVSVQFEASSLDRHLASGRPWDLDRTRGGYRRLVPEEGRTRAVEGFSSGNVDDLLRLSPQIADLRPDVVVVMSADQVFRLDVRQVVAQHLTQGSEVTVVTAEVAKTEAKHKTLVDVGDEGLITGMSEKPTTPEHGVVAAEIFVYSTDALLRELDALRRELAQEEPGLPDGLGDFPRLVERFVERGTAHAFALEGYWRDLGRPGAYLAAHRELLRGKVDVFDDPTWPIRSHFPELPPAMVHAGAVVEDSLLTPGTQVRGTVRRSVLGPGCVVEAGAVVEDCVLMDEVVVRADAVLTAAVVDHRCEFAKGATVGSSPKRWPPADSAVVLVGRESTVGPGVSIEAGARLEPGTTA